MAESNITMAEYNSMDEPKDNIMVPDKDNQQPWQTRGVWLGPLLGYTETLEEAELVLQEYQICTGSKYIVSYKRVNFGKHFKELFQIKHKVIWQVNDNPVSNSCTNMRTGLVIPFDSVPFIFAGKKVFECRHGQDKGMGAKLRWKKLAEERLKTDPNFKVRTARTQPSFKVGCTAQIHITHIIRFSDYAIVTNSAYWRRTMSNKLKDATNESPDAIYTSERFYISLHDPKDHFNHPLKDAEMVRKAHYLRLHNQGGSSSKMVKRGRRDVDTAPNIAVQSFEGETSVPSIREVEQILLSASPSLMPPDLINKPVVPADTVENTHVIAAGCITENTSGMHTCQVENTPGLPSGQVGNTPGTPSGQVENTHVIAAGCITGNTSGMHTCQVENTAGLPSGQVGNTPGTLSGQVKNTTGTPSGQIDNTPGTPSGQFENTYGITPGQLENAPTMPSGQFENTPDMSAGQVEDMLVPSSPTVMHSGYNNEYITTTAATRCAKVLEKLIEATFLVENADKILELERKATELLHEASTSIKSVASREQIAMDDVVMTSVTDGDTQQRGPKPKAINYDVAQTVPVTRPPVEYVNLPGSAPPNLIYYGTNDHILPVSPSDSSYQE